MWFNEKESLRACIKQAKQKSVKHDNRAWQLLLLLWILSHCALYSLVHCPCDDGLAVTADSAESWRVEAC